MWWWSYTALDPILTSLDAVGSVLTLGLAYYEVRILLGVRKGILERSWKYIATGAVFVAIGTAVFAFEGFGSASVDAYLTYGGTTLSFSAILVPFSSISTSCPKQYRGRHLNKPTGRKKTPT